MNELEEIRVIVVDGDPLLRQRLVQEVAKRTGITVVATAMGFRTGLPKIESYHPDVVLVDLVTDSVEGLELCERLRADGSDVAMIGMAPEGAAGPRATRAKELAVRLVGRPVEYDDVGFLSWLDGVCARCRDGSASATTSSERVRPAVPPRDLSAGDATAREARPRDPAARERTVVAEPVVPARTVAPSLAPAEPRNVDRARPTARPSTATVPPADALAAIARGAMPGAVPARPVRRGGRVEAIGIGISTGGPKALAVMLPMLPADLSVPVLIVQHMPPVFTASLAESLARNCKLPVREARAGEPVLPGHILIAPGGKHMRVSRGEHGVVIRITEDPPENSCRPAVDYLFRSLAEVYGAATCAVMMTGMGEDGFAACRQLHDLGARIIAQDEASCTVFGMPRGPIAAGIVDVVAPLDAIAGRVVDAIKGDGR